MNQKDRIKELETKVDALEKRVAEMGLAIDVLLRKTPLGGTYTTSEPLYPPPLQIWCSNIPEWRTSGGGGLQV